MRFALLGDHPDGLDMAGALVDSGRHQVSAVCGLTEEEVLRRLGPLRRFGDLEEVLADPAIEAVIVAGPAAVRAAQLRRALQSERHVLCVHPADETPDTGYEAAMLQRDTGYVLLPLLPEGLHPAFARLKEFMVREDPTKSPIGAFRLAAFERAGVGEVLENAQEGLKPSLPGWDVLRLLGGEVIEVVAFADGEELAAGAPVILAGRFTQGGLFRMTLIPGQPAAWWSLSLIGTAGSVELTFPQGWNGPAILEWRDETGQRREEYHEPFDPWPALVQAFESAVAGEAVQPSWQDAVRSLELDDAARRSVERRRSNVMEYPEGGEEVGFKGTMTLVGCGLLWGVLLLLVVSAWVPWMGWLILPLLVVFIAMQVLRYAIPKEEKGTKQEGR
jgi:predicted dehydrogenase